MSSFERPYRRIKLGEIFLNENHGYEFTCGHCLYDFKQFAEFAVHVQEYLEEMIMYQQSVATKSESESELAQQLMAEAVPEDVDDNNQTEESCDNESDVELVIESNAENEAGDDVVYVVIGDEESDTRVAGTNEEDDNDDSYEDIDENEEIEYADLDEEIENEPEEDRTSAPVDGGYKCPLCKSCYSTIDFLQMHLSNYHSKSTIYNYLAVASTNDPNIMHPIKLSKRIEDLPCENILLEESPEAAEYSKYLFGFRFDKIASGLSKCPKCHFTGTRFKVKNHVFTHLQAKVFKCMICQQRYKTLSACRLHMRKIHLCT